MKYIFREQLLNFSGRPTAVNQYHQWAEKKRVQKERQEEEKLQVEWEQIQREEKEETKRNTWKTRQQSQVKAEQTYVKNLIWKQTVDDKIERLRLQKQEEQEIKETRAMQISAEKPRDKYEFREEEHKGPIKAWAERFNSYIKGRAQPQEHIQGSFHPKINPISQRITSRMVGKVEDRLIEYGQRVKMRRAELEAQQQDSLIAARTKIDNTSISSQQSQVYFRLYKDGERLNQRKNQLYSQYSFTPQINQYSEALARHNQHRRRPLHEPKQPKRPLKEQPSRMSTPVTFQNFMQRNQALLHKIESHKMTRIQMIKQKENLEDKHCTFAPVLNAHSQKIVREKVLEESESQVHGEKALEPQFTNLEAVDPSDLTTERIQEARGGYSMGRDYLRDDGLSYSDIRGEEETVRKDVSAIEDSIERLRDEDWEKQLLQMEENIEAMMKRTPLQ